MPLSTDITTLAEQAAGLLLHLLCKVQEVRSPGMACRAFILSDKAPRRCYLHKIFWEETSCRQPTIKPSAASMRKQNGKSHYTKSHYSDPYFQALHAKTTQHLPDCLHLAHPRVGIERRQLGLSTFTRLKDTSTCGASCFQSLQIQVVHEDAKKRLCPMPRPKTTYRMRTGLWKALPEERAAAGEYAASVIFIMGQS
jgi:hypothetical protein